MTHRERFFTLLSGKEVAQVPFFPDITDWYKARRTPCGEIQKIPTGSFIPDSHPIHKRNIDMPEEYADFTILDFYRRFDWGLPVHIYDWYDEEYDGVDKDVETTKTSRITRFRCKEGVVERVDSIAADGSLCPHTHFVRTPKDLKIIEYISTHTKVIPRHERAKDILKGIGEQGVADVVIKRSPFGKLVHEFMGMEKMIYALTDEPSAIESFLNIVANCDINVIKKACDSPCRIIIFADNADDSLISPRYYQKYCIPFYQTACGILHEHGKIVSVHMDGNIKGFLPLLKETGFDLLDGCTPAPMTNYEVEELFPALGENIHAYCGVPSTLFTQKVNNAEIIRFAERIVKTLGNRVILNVGDVLPPNGDIKQVIKLDEWAKENIVRV